jgi:hypothetical protein
VKIQVSPEILWQEIKRITGSSGYAVAGEKPNRLLVLTGNQASHIYFVDPQLDGILQLRYIVTSATNIAKQLLDDPNLPLALSNLPGAPEHEREAAESRLQQLVREAYSRSRPLQAKSESGDFPFLLNYENESYFLGRSRQLANNDKSMAIVFLGIWVVGLATVMIGSWSLSVSGFAASQSCFLLLVLITFAPMAVYLWRYYRTRLIARDGRVVRARLVDYHGEMRSVGRGRRRYHLRIDFEFTSPISGAKLKGRAGAFRGENEEHYLPPPGTFVAVAYVNDSRFRLL